MKIDDLSLVTEISVRDFGREVGSHVVAMPSVISGMWGDETGRENATQRIARGKFVNNFTNKFLASLDNYVNNAKVSAQTTANYGKGGAGVPNTSVTPTFKSAQQPQVKESLESKLDILLNEQQQGQIPLATELKQMIVSYMSGYTLTKVDDAINQFCKNIEVAYNSNQRPVGDLRKLGNLLFGVIIDQKNASQPKRPNTNPESDQMDSQAQEAINIIKTLGSRNNTYAVALASLKQLRKADPAAYAKLMASVNNT